MSNFTILALFGYGFLIIFGTTNITPETNTVTLLSVLVYLLYVVSILLLDAEIEMRRINNEPFDYLN